MRCGYSQPLWPTRPGPEELRRGWEVVQKARGLAPPTERERLFVDAAAAFFSEPASLDYWPRIHRWAEAMETLHDALPQDSEAAAFYALAHLATAPADVVTRAHADHAAEILLAVYTEHPGHPGAMHYLVHANDVPGREQESLEIIRLYETVAPHNPHALHMPTHIYTRLGDWEAVINGNVRAAEAALEHPAEHSLEFYPRRFNSLLGAARAARASGDEARARPFYRELLEVAGESTREPALEEARTFVFQHH